MFDNSFINRVLHKAAWGVVLPLCLMGAAVQAWVQAPAAPGSAISVGELPSHWQGRPLRPLALSEVEARFAQRFPGSISRMTDGRQVLVLRGVDQPTRMLHPAADCYQGLGYAITNAQLTRDDGGLLWRCFEATRNGRRLRVCERIAGADGSGFTDASAWYWAALLGQSTGPWQAWTVATPL